MGASSVCRREDGPAGWANCARALDTSSSAGFHIECVAAEARRGYSGPADELEASRIWCGGW